MRRVNELTAYTTDFMNAVVAKMSFYYLLLFLSLLTSICLQVGTNFPISLFAFLNSIECKSTSLSSEIFSDAWDTMDILLYFKSLASIPTGLGLYTAIFHQLQTE